MPSLRGAAGHLMAGRLNGTSRPGHCTVAAAARTLWSAAQSRRRSLPGSQSVASWRIRVPGRPRVLRSGAVRIRP
jgi:hypothetical protein